jgi:hypothetical protein
MPTPWQNVYGVVWGVLILRVVGLLALAHKNPLVTPLVLRVLGEKKSKKKEKRAASKIWCKLASHGSYESDTHALLRV